MVDSSRPALIGRSSGGYRRDAPEFNHQRACANAMKPIRSPAVIPGQSADISG
jgi:hypothetical protein